MPAKDDRSARGGHAGVPAIGQTGVDAARPLPTADAGPECPLPTADPSRERPLPTVDPRRERPLLMVDVDGVISLFSFGADSKPDGRFHSIDGIPHFLSAQAASHLLELWPLFEPVWASGWEEKANEYLPHLLGLPGPLPYLSFERAPGRANAHWKLQAIDTYAGSRPLAWIDDAFDDACHEWAGARDAPTLLVQTSPCEGLTRREAQALALWASTLTSDSIR